MTEEQLAQIEAGAIRLPIGAKDRKGADICLGDTVHFADAEEWGSPDTPEWVIRMKGGKLPHPTRFCEVVGTDGVDPAAIVAEVRRLQAEIKAAEDGFVDAADRSGILAGEIEALQAENAALRARAVPAVVWRLTDSGCEAVSGAIDMGVTRLLNGRAPYKWEIGCGEDILRSGYALTEAEARARCEAAFLWLVGVQNE